MLFLDVECFKNYFLLYFKFDNNEGDLSGKKATFEIINDKVIGDRNVVSSLMSKHTTVGFNSKSYDLNMIAYYLMGAKNSALKAFSDDLITNKTKRYWELNNERGVYIPKEWDHIDIISPAASESVAIGTDSVGENNKVGLKTCASRMHSLCLQELPYDISSELSDDMIHNVKTYCENDLDVTIELYDRIKEGMILRERLTSQYNIDMRSKSRAQIAETIIKSKLKIGYNSEQQVPEKISYIAPKYIKFNSYVFNKLLFDMQISDYYLDSKTGKINKDSSRNFNIIYDNKLYKTGLGGLHSEEKAEYYLEDEGHMLLDIDFSSYYPMIMINNNYYPKNIGESFIDLLKHFVNQKNEAEKKKQTQDVAVYKIVLNGAFGKYGSKYSPFYDPESLLKITITGQLFALMLVEGVTELGCKVISANTDGITVKLKRSLYGDLQQYLKTWEARNLDYKLVQYKAIYYESVNSYFAVKLDGSIKGKGYYADEGLSKVPLASVCKEAIFAYLTEGIPLLEYIKNCYNSEQYEKFILVQKSTEGAKLNNKYLGKIVRWFYSNNDCYIERVKSLNKVPLSDGAIECMDLRKDSDCWENWHSKISLIKYKDLAIKHLIALGINYDA